MLWFVLGFFIVIKEIPHFGEFIGVMISIVPFIIVLISVLICILNLLALFFVLPIMVLKGYKKMQLIRHVITNLNKNLFVNVSFFLLCLMFVFFISFILIIITGLTNICFSIPVDYLYKSLQWFFLMIPLIVLLSPVVIFFFNISCETYNLLQTRNKNV